ncbi:Hypothetical Protein RradSPS_1255 [Rubrobacter radiotolerans]|uniref:Uncharacterized protein n=1 Tax=Rubrobacter radiotolerans TaxID=42256 RepID=A0A023X2H3_RUBRA|nr:hypothetical protein [Rubrobacter radiotolerans]AHY46538.1 Hypothetical Protein RradSPS_1255 [Rubrobacter radiotolerans]MDX5893946.1 hypothetical protein [Rubrobacter radiotolerans]SMC04833.1 conserved hypothetical protein [Rubrobacter radiotolerans DSM 5868]
MLHGIKRERNTSGNVEARGGIVRITIRYKDGSTTTVVPDAGRKTFSEDDAKELKKVLDSAASRLEWEEKSRRLTM